MDRRELTGLIGELDHILGVISRYRKQNQYVYPRPFESWCNGYNRILDQLADADLPVAHFRLEKDDYSPSGKSIRPESVDRLVESIRALIAHLEERVEELTRALEEKLAAPHPLAEYFPRDADGSPIEPSPVKNLVLVAVPAGAVGERLLREAILPVLEARGLDCCRAQGFLVDEAAFAELCRQLCACRLAVFALARRDPGVMLALGLARGIGKPLLTLQPRSEGAVAVLGEAGLTYSDAEELKAELGRMLSRLLESAEDAEKENA
ncbi:hypothetical protein EDC39_103213 [Geothermobacter ehrlichii]|uniref:Uncharacterized protein n=1 Tax=Geothermobacter ehrlichii TaxID=213224 RepID=A0A5D3WLQ3_9BACT|nr:hypothetical protein [Geothermobacter ehrlichii]TYO99367.1 hypothetical protein EDC39_103213 [Geothermobacter ehrlichii]